MRISIQYCQSGPDPSQFYITGKSFSWSDFSVVLTGKNPDKNQLENGSDAVHKAMLDASTTERATIAAAQNPGGAGYHAYSILKVTANGADGGTVTLRD